MNVRTTPRPNRLNQEFIAATISLGFPQCPDFSGPDPEGVGLRQAIIRRGERETTARTHLHAAVRSARVTVITHALASHVIVDGGRAAGVAYERGGAQHEARATREVILTAGALQTPQLLYPKSRGRVSLAGAAGQGNSAHLGLRAVRAPRRSELGRHQTGLCEEHARANGVICRERRCARVGFSL